MAREAGDPARLRRIEDELERADPELAETFRRWQPRGSGFTARGWSAVPLWMVFVFLVAFATWTMAPLLGVLAATAGLVCWLRARVVARGAAVSGPSRR